MHVNVYWLFQRCIRWCAPWMSDLCLTLGICQKGFFNARGRVPQDCEKGYPMIPLFAMRAMLSEAR